MNEKEIITYADKTTAQAIINAASVSLGYPLPVVNHGGGRNAPKEMSETAYCAKIVDGKDGTFGIVVTDEMKNVLGDAVKARIQTVNMSAWVSKPVPTPEDSVIAKPIDAKIDLEIP
jgi:hypothetical protein